MIERIKVYLDQHRNYFNLPEEREIIVRLQAPWRISRTSRCIYWVKLEFDPEYRLVIQEATSLSGIESARNLYEPTFWDKVNDLLPKNRGKIKIESSWYYWSDFFAAPSILELATKQGWFTKTETDGSSRQILEEVVNQFISRQATNITISSDYIQENKELILVNLGNPQLIQFFLSNTQPIWDWLEALPPIPCTWADGALWPKDIFIVENKLKIIDWEWAVEQAPIGSDIYEFYLFCCEIFWGMDYCDAVKIFEKDGIEQLSFIKETLVQLWQRLSLVQSDFNIIVVFVLLRQYGRILADDGYYSVDYMEPFTKLMQDIIHQ